MIKRIIGLLIMIFLAANVYAVLDPSAVYCDEIGYVFTIKNTPEGEQGICILPDGSSVDSWNFLKGKVGKEHSYCEKQGYILKTINDSKKCSSIFSYDCAVCVKEDGEEVEVTTLMNLSFSGAVCGDGFCTVVETYLDCPEDCPSGMADGYCDKIEDGSCDPDCTPEEDTDCEIKPERPAIVECIDGDGACHCECIGKDSDCEYENASITPCVDNVPKSGIYPEPEIEIECVYDGVCYLECEYDFDCECIDPESKRCKKALIKFKEIPDGVCHAVEDGACDPDCTPEEDPDCKPKISPLVILIALILAAGIITGFVYYWKKKK